MISSMLFTSGLFNIVSNYMGNHCISLDKLMRRQQSNNGSLNI